MPIRIHLDTSDFSAMYRAEAGTREAEVRHCLEDLVDRGDVQIGMSYYLILELLPQPEPRYRADRLARAQFLKRLCGTNAFAYDGDLGAGLQFSNKGNWLPKNILDDLEIETLVREAMRLVEPNITRMRFRGVNSTRRGVFVDYVQKNPNVLDLIRPNAWPLTVAVQFLPSGDMTRYVLGEITREEANARLRGRICDPVLFYKNWIEPFGMQAFDDKRQNLAAKMSDIMQMLQNMVGEGKTLRRRIKDALAANGENRLTGPDREQLVRLDREIKIFDREITSPVELAERVTGWKEYYGEKSALVAAEILFAFNRKNRPFKSNDAADFVHAMCLPHADLWRGDRAMSDLLIKNKVTGCEKVVESLPDLPPRIALELQRGAA